MAGESACVDACVELVEAGVAVSGERESAESLGRTWCGTTMRSVSK